MSKITLNHVSNLIDTTTAETIINADLDTIQAAIDNTLSRDGTSPNKMASNLDMDSFQIINLPTPSSSTSPLRLQDLVSFLGGTINVTPSGTLVGVQFFTSSGAYIRSANVTKCLAFVVGGGGGGGGAGANASEVAIGRGGGGR